MARPRGERTAASYLSRDPVKRLNQLKNLHPAKLGTYRPAVQARKRLQEIDIIEFATHKDYLNLSFKKRPAQEVILRVLYGLPLNLDQQEMFQILTKSKGKYTPGQEKSEAVLALGARAGKSFLASVCALFESTRGTWKQYLAKDEYAYVVVVATRELQSRQIIQASCLRMLENSPVLRKWIVKSTDLEITLKNSVKIISSPCNSTALRGLPIPVLILDEISFYRIEGVNADEVIFNSLRPRQAQFPNNKLFMISTAGSKQGLFYREFDRGFRVEDRLTCQASTSFVNPVIPQAFLAKEKIRDINNFEREFEAIFSEKLESFFTFEMVERPFVLAGDLAYEAKNSYYLAFDQSGLSGKDRFACAITHTEEDIAITDCVRSWATKDLDEILSEVKKLAGEYHLNKCLVDRFAVGYVRNALNSIDIEIELRPSLAEVFVNLKSLILQDRLSLPDRPDLRGGMRNTIAVYNKSNQLSILHERGPEGHADELDAVASAIYGCSKKLGETGPRIRTIGGDGDEEDGRNWQPVFGEDDNGHTLPEKYSQL